MIRILKALPVLSLLLLFACADHTGTLMGRWYIKRIEFEDGKKAMDTRADCYFIDFLPEDHVVLNGTTVSEGDWKSRDSLIFVHTTTVDTMQILILTRDSLALRFPSQHTYMRYMLSKRKGHGCG